MKFLLVALCGLALASSIDVEICDPDITHQHFDNLDLFVKPDPILVKEGEDLSLHFALDILTPVLAGGTIDIKIKKGGAIPLPVPCIDVSLYQGQICFL